jgi:hypothetical protein
VTNQRLTAEPPPFIPPQEVPQVASIPPEILEEMRLAGELGETRRIVGAPLEEEGVFTPTDDERSEFVNLMTCGKRTKVIEVMGHSVGIESLNVDDDLRISRFTKDYKDTDGFARAVHVATCAAGIRTVDGRMLYTALSMDESLESIFQAKLEKLLKWYPVTITEIYRGIINLDVEFVELAVKLGKLTG